MCLNQTILGLKLNIAVHSDDIQPGLNQTILGLKLKYIYIY